MRKRARVVMNQLPNRWYANREELATFFKDKRVIIVGPAEYLEGEGIGKWIDGYDIVVRMNRSRPIPKDYGSRTDVLFNFITELWIEYFAHQHPFVNDGVKLILTTTTIPRYYREFKARMKVPAYVIPKKEYGAIRGEIGSKPNTGTVAIAYLLTYPIKSLDVVGMDLYASGYCKGYGGNLDPGAHNFDAQALYIDTLQRDERLHLDYAMLDRIKNAQHFTDEPIIEPLPPISIVIPYGYCGEYREQLMNWTVNRYKKLFPECEICIGECDDKPFNRAKAKNNGISKATNDLVLIVDNDALFNRSLVHEALNLMETHNQHWIRAGGKSFRINEQSTKELISIEGNVDIYLQTEGTYSTNFFCLVHKDFLLETPGFDEGFKDWGGEDYAFYKTLDMWEREGKRTTGKIWHMWHPSSEQSAVHMQALKMRDLSVPTVRRHIQYSNVHTKAEILKIRGLQK